MTEAALDPTPSSPSDQPSGPASVDRGISPVGDRFGMGMAGKVVTFVALLAGCGVFVAAGLRHPGSSPKGQPAEPARQVVNFEPVDAKAATGSTSGPALAPTLAHPGLSAPTLDLEGRASGPIVPALQASAPEADAPAARQAQAAAATSRAAQVQAMRGAPILVFSAPRGAGGVQSSPLVVPLASATDPAQTELDQLRRGSNIGLSRAHRLPDRNFLIAAGTSIPCTLQTAMDTSTPGYVSCLIGQNVYSDNGAVVLLEKGAKVLGEYRSGLRQGQRRLFVLWTRAVTPAGVAIGLASPATDALGRAGFDGALDDHFWERFGGALLLSIVDDGSAALTAKADPNSETLHVPSNAASVALQNTINIPPTLRKAQGSEVSIFAAQDFDFSSVYGLRPR